MPIVPAADGASMTGICQKRDRGAGLRGRREQKRRRRPCRRLQVLEGELLRNAGRMTQRDGGGFRPIHLKPGRGGMPSKTRLIVTPQSCGRGFSNILFQTKKAGPAVTAPVLLKPRSRLFASRLLPRGTAGSPRPEGRRPAPGRQYMPILFSESEMKMFFVCV